MIIFDGAPGAAGDVWRLDERDGDEHGGESALELRTRYQPKPIA